MFSAVSGSDKDREMLFFVILMFLRILAFLISRDGLFGGDTFVELLTVLPLGGSAAAPPLFPSGVFMTSTASEAAPFDTERVCVAGVKRPS